MGEGAGLAAVMVSESVAALSEPPVGVPSTLALLVMLPAVTSAAVVVWVAVQVVYAPAARLVTEQVIVPSLSSVKTSELIVTLPVLVTR